MTFRLWFWCVYNANEKRNDCDHKMKIIMNVINKNELTIFMFVMTFWDFQIIFGFRTFWFSLFLPLFILLAWCGCPLFKILFRKKVICLICSSCTKCETKNPEYDNNNEKQYVLLGKLMPISFICAFLLIFYRLLLANCFDCMFDLEHFFHLLSKTDDGLVKFCHELRNVELIRINRFHVMNLTFDKHNDCGYYSLHSTQYT